MDLGLAGLALASIAGAGLAGNLLGGWLSHHAGSRAALVAGLVTAAAGSLSVALVFAPRHAVAAAAPTRPERRRERGPRAHVAVLAAAREDKAHARLLYRRAIALLEPAVTSDHPTLHGCRQALLVLMDSGPARGAAPPK